MVLKINDVFYPVKCLALHRRHRHGVYRRNTNWMAQAGDITAWGRTRSEAIARLKQNVRREF
jgi:hypothetical protein